MRLFHLFILCFLCFCLSCSLSGLCSRVLVCFCCLFFLIFFLFFFSVRSCALFSTPPRPPVSSVRFLFVLGWPVCPLLLSRVRLLVFSLGSLSVSACLFVSWSVLFSAVGARFRPWTSFSFYLPLLLASFLLSSLFFLSILSFPFSSLFFSILSSFFSLFSFFRSFLPIFSLLGPLLRPCFFFTP